jgi:hypothetical protein
MIKIYMVAPKKEGNRRQMVTATAQRFQHAAVDSKRMITQQYVKGENLACIYMTDTRKNLACPKVS